MNSQSRGLGPESSAVDSLGRADASNRLDLPAPPEGKTGWPWSVDSRFEAGKAVVEESTLPRVSVVTPSYNQADFIEETLRSVLLQDYDDLEYLVVDGGSTDGSVGILERYSPWLSYWVSEPDRGQSHAINKGFQCSTGDILAWLNTDDIYYPGAVRAAVEEMERSGADLLLGAMDKVTLQEGQVRFQKRSSPLQGEPIHRFPVLANGKEHRFHFFQPSMFWRRSLWERAGSLDERFHYVMDLEWCNRALSHGPRVTVTEEVFTRFMLHPASKSGGTAHRLRGEEALMYLRLMRLPGFSRLNCLRASVWPAFRWIALAGAYARQDARRGRAMALRFGAKALKPLATAFRGSMESEAG